MLNRSVAPTLPEKINFITPQLGNFTLSNGINVFHIERNELPIIKIYFILDKGSLEDPKTKWGVANLTAMLIDENADELNALEIDTLIEKLGAHFTIAVNQDYTTFSILSLKENFESVMELISKILIKPNFTAEDFDRERAKAIDNLVRLMDEPSFIADWAMANLTMQGSPYQFPNIGTSESIPKITLDDIKSYYNEFYKSENFRILAVGDIDRVELNTVLNKYFSNIPSGKITSHEKIILGDLEKTIFLINKKDAPQSEIRLANFSSLRTDADYFPKKLMNSILGGQFSSRLNHNLREEKGITYGIHTDFHYSKNWGLFETSTAVDTKNTLIAVQEILKEFELIQKTIDETETDFAKSYSTKVFPLFFETISKISSSFLNVILYDLDDTFFRDYLINIENVSSEQIIEAANKNVSLDKNVIVVVGDSKILEPLFRDNFPNYNLRTLEINELGV